MNNFISKDLYVLCMLIMVAILTIIIPGMNDDLLPICSSFAIVVISSIAIISGPVMPYSLAKIFNIFTYLFFGIVPIVTYKFNILYWGAKEFTSSDYILTNIIILIALITFNFTYSAFINSKLMLGNWRGAAVARIRPLRAPRIALFLVVLSCAVSYLIFYKNGFDVINVWTRGKLGDNSVIIETNQIEYLFLSYFITPILSINLVIYRILNLRLRLAGFVLLILLILSAPPTSMARFAAAAMYMPILFVYVSYFSRQHFLSIFIIFSLFFIFPILDMFRLGLPENWSDLIGFSENINMFYSGHFDAYQSLMMVLNENFVTYGYQLMSALLFFVPRAFWQDKGVGSGQEMAKRYNLTSENISATYMAEGYINFGLLGIILFILMLSYFCAYMDKRYWAGVGARDSLGFRTFYLYSIPLLFFVLRGDLMSSFAYFCGFGVAVLSVNLLSRYRLMI